MEGQSIIPCQHRLAYRINSAVYTSLILFSLTFLTVVTTSKAMLLGARVDQFLTPPSVLLWCCLTLIRASLDNRVAKRWQPPASFLCKGAELQSATVGNFSGEETQKAELPLPCTYALTNCVVLLFILGFSPLVLSLSLLSPPRQTRWEWSRRQRNSQTQSKTSLKIRLCEKTGLLTFSALVTGWQSLPEGASLLAPRLRAPPV